MPDKDVTLQVILEHLLAFKVDVMDFKGDVNNNFATIDRRFDQLEHNLTRQIDALDQRLDTIEIAIADQKHEPRIRRLEKYAGFRT